jgi:NAD(P)-dependent dehydrogenase (short-subunit alcohol dehydrogenase family)
MQYSVCIQTTCVSMLRNAVSLQVPVHCVTLDMRDLDAVSQLPAQLPDEFKEVDILINNAGLALGVTTVTDHDIQVCSQAAAAPQGCSCLPGHICTALPSVSAQASLTHTYGLWWQENTCCIKALPVSEL